MTPIHFIALGFVLGAVVTALSLLAKVGRFKWENMRAKALHTAMEAKARQAEQQRALYAKKMINANAEVEFIKQEVDRLRNQKLDAWDVPDGI